MVLTLKIKLLPTPEQAVHLLNTIIEANRICEEISDIAWRNKIFNQFKLHYLCYHNLKSSSKVNSQIIVRSIAKVSKSYKVYKDCKRSFKPTGGINYDHNILSYRPNDIASIWTVGGRLKIPYSCHNKNLFNYIKGESSLVFKRGKFYIHQYCNVAGELISETNDFIGVDLGITDIAVTSDGIKYSSDKLTAYREKRQKVRSSLQSKGTKGSKKVLKRLSGREKTTSTIINHTISKQIVKSAKEQGKGIAIEDLTSIRTNSKRRSKKFRTKLGKWNFFQLRQFLTYKSELSGVKLIVVEPAYTSKSCSVCYRIGNRSGKYFKCTECGNSMDADLNGSRNIATLGAVINQPEKSTMYCALHS